MPWISAIINVYKILHLQLEIENRSLSSQDRKSAREELGAWKVKIEIIIFYSNEYAITDICNILNRTILQEKPKPVLINCCTLGWCGITIF